MLGHATLYLSHLHCLFSVYFSLVGVCLFTLLSCTAHRVAHRSGKFKSMSLRGTSDEEGRRNATVHSKDYVWLFTLEASIFILTPVGNGCKLFLKTPCGSWQIWKTFRDFQKGSSCHWTNSLKKEIKK